jgi:RNA polymerase sigma-70 factor (ECF subfamily)
VQGQAPVPDPDLDRQRTVVDALLAAARKGDFETLIAVLDPDVVLRADSGPVHAAASREVHGARAVAELALAFSQVAHFSRPALVNGTPGLVTAPGGELVSIMGFTITDDRIVEIDILADAARLARLDLMVLDDGGLTRDTDRRSPRVSTRAGGGPLHVPAPRQIGERVRHVGRNDPRPRATTT